MKVKDYGVVVGFSVNPEVVAVYDSSGGGEKLPLKEIRVDLSGSAADVAIAVNKLGQRSLLFGFKGPENGDAGALLKSAVHKAGVDFVPLEVLNSTSIAVLPVDEAHPLHVVGRKGDVCPEKIKSGLARMKNTLSKSIGAWRVATGLRCSEKEFAQSLFSEEGCIGNRVFSPNRAFCDLKEREGLFELIKKVDLLIMNRYEYAGCAVSTPAEIHRMGPAVLIVTEDAQGGFYSMNGSIRRFEAIHYPCERAYPTGAGDWFLGGLLSELIAKNIREVSELTEGALQECLLFAAKVAGKKVTIPGSSRGPSRSEI
ncbi:MAG: carbohydrate kinase family protein [Patescibacteria group bacterium]|nr:carbohydrate kinase family protein [Patescibacteria group bacterium]